MARSTRQPGSVVLCTSDDDDTFDLPVVPAPAALHVASSDIFFLEACFYSMMCSNRDQLFWVEPGADWECNLDRRGFERMRDMILRPKK